jgi:hypothetical protein
VKCPHCAVGVNVDWFKTFAYVDDIDDPEKGKEIIHGECPVCEGVIIKLIEGPVEEINSTYHVEFEEIQHDQIIYPVSSVRPVEPEVKEPYRSEYIEACSVLTISPKASAALSRRLLQTLLRNEFNIKPSSLAKEIETFIHLDGIPSHLSGAIDAIRNVGNFAAHPLKDTNTGEVVDVEPGEAEWLLDVIDSLFDFTLVQPLRLKERKDKLNEKLKALGKPPMKG